MKSLLALLALLVCAIVHAGTVQTCYAARLYVNLPAEAAGHDLYMNIYYYNGDGVKTHVGAVLTQGHLIAGYAPRWSGTPESESGL
jgi:hypothetical protein